MMFPVDTVYNSTSYMLYVMQWFWELTLGTRNSKYFTINCLKGETRAFQQRETADLW